MMTNVNQKLRIRKHSTRRTNNLVKTTEIYTRNIRVVGKLVNTASSAKGGPLVGLL